MDFHQTRSFRRVFSDTFLFLRQHFLPLFTALIVIAGPFLLLTALYNSTFLIKLITLTPQGSSSDPIFLIEHMKPYVIYNYVFILVTNIVITAVVYEYVVLYIGEGISSISLGTLVGHLKHDFLRVLGTGIISGVFVIFGFFFFLIPGIYLSIALSPVFMVVLYERQTIFESFPRCCRLVSGNWWNTFWVLLLPVLIQLFLEMVLSLPRSIVSAQAASAMTDSGIPAGYQIRLLLTSVVSSLSYLLYAIPMVAIAFHYFNLAAQHPMEPAARDDGYYPNQ